MENACRLLKVVASALVYNDKGKILAIRVPGPDNKLIYIPPGGKVERGETLRECAEREVKEEVNIDIKTNKLVALLEKEYDDGIWTFVYYQAEVCSGQIKNNEDHEIREISWVDINEICDFKELKWVKQEEKHE
jgi:8-oxo-dGTP diphosphatase